MPWCAAPADAVQEIERFSADLKVDALLEFEDPRQCYVLVEIPGGAELRIVARGIAEYRIRCRVRNANPQIELVLVVPKVFRRIEFLAFDGRAPVLIRVDEYAAAGADAGWRPSQRYPECPTRSSGTTTRSNRR